MALSEKLELLVGMNLTNSVSEIQRLATETERSTKQAESSLSRYAANATKIGAAGVGVGGLLTQLGSSEQAAAQQLDAAIGQVGQSYSDYKARIDEAVSAQARFGHSEAETKDALTTLTVAYGDTGKALNEMQLVADIAARKHESLSEAATQVAKAHGGASRIFREFGVEVQKNTDGSKDFDGALAVLAQKLQGQASASADTFTGKLKALGIQIENQAADFGQKYGPAILIASTGLTALGSVTQFVSGVQAKRAAAAAAEAVATKAAAVANAELATSEAVVVGNTSAAVASLYEEATAATTAATSSLALKTGLLGLIGIAGAAAGGMRELGDEHQSFIQQLAAHPELANADLAKQFIAGGTNTDAIKQFFGAIAKDAPEAAQRLDDAVKAAGGDASAFDIILAQTTDTTSNLTSATDASTSALTKQAKAMETADKAATGRVTATRTLYDATVTEQQSEQNLAAAQHSAEQATNRVTDAQNKLAAARQRASADDATRGNLDLSDANFRVADSAQTVTDEETKLEQLRAKGGTADQVAQQERRVAEARNNHERSVLAVHDAEQKLQDLRKKGTEQDANVVTAEQNLAAAQDALKTAQDSVTTAQIAQQDAATKVLKAQEEMQGGVQNSNQALRDQVNEFSNLAKIVDPNSPQGKLINEYLSRLLELQQSFPPAPSDVNIAANRNTPQFAEGGIVPGPIGRPRLALVHGGEGVFTPEQMRGRGSGGDVIQHIYAPTDPDEQQRAAVRYWREHALLNAG